MYYLTTLKRITIGYSALIMKAILFIFFIIISLNSTAQLLFSEPFNEPDGSTSGIDNIGSVNWSTICPNCINAADYYKVDTGELVAQDSNGPATWETENIDISSTQFFNISLLLKEEGTMEACGTGCSSVDWVQLEYNIDNTGWQTPNNSYLCSGPCAGINVIHSDDIAGPSLNYSTDCIESGANLKLRIIVQAWAASERWIIDDIQVSTAISPSIDAGIDHTICANTNITLTADNPQNGILTWNNTVIDGVNFIPQPGNNPYVVSTNLNGCIATDTVLITLNSQPTFTVLGTNPTTCTGIDGIITLSGLNPTTSYQISYSHNAIIIGPNTFTSDVNGIIIISSLPTSTYSNFLVDLLGCSTQSNSTINLINPLVPTISAGNTQLVCEGENVVLSAENPNNAILSWNNSITDGVAFTPLLGTTNYTVTANLNGCISTDDVDVISAEVPQVSTIPDFSICEGQTITLTATNNTPATITWNNGIQDGVPFISTVGTTIYTATANLLGCIATSQTAVIVNTTPTLTLLASNPITCLGSDGSITLSGLDNMTNFTISYTNSGNQVPLITTSDLNGKILITGLSSGTYTNFIIDQAGCTNQDNSILNLTDPLPPLIDAGTDKNICIGDNITLTALNPNNATISWNNTIVDGVAFQPINDTSYVVIAILNNCINSDTTSIFIFAAPIIDAGSDQAICYGDTVLLHASNLNGNFISWDNNVTDSIKFIPESTLIYTITSTIGTCTDSDEVEIIVHSLPSAIFTLNPNNPTMENTEVTFNILNSNPTIETYAWSFGDHKFSSLESPIHLFPEKGSITYDINLIVTDTAGCKNLSSTIITINDILLYYVPNAFTPDGDQVNNIFQPIFTSGFNPQDYHLLIFNRWGETIFESFNSEIGWNGVYKNNKMAEQTVYVWSITFGESVSDKKYNVAGYVTLLR